MRGCGGSSSSPTNICGLWSHFLYCHYMSFMSYDRVKAVGKKTTSAKYNYTDSSQEPEYNHKFSNSQEKNVNGIGRG